MDNSGLINKIKNGDEKGYMMLINMYHTKLHAYALGLVKCPETANDIVQNVFISLWEYRNKLNTELSLQAFLYKSIFNEFLNTKKSIKTKLIVQGKFLQHLNNTVHDPEINSELDLHVKILEREIKNLPPRCYEIFSLSKKEGMTNKEISIYLNISIKTVETQITKAYKILRKKLNLATNYHSDKPDEPFSLNQLKESG